MTIEICWKCKAQIDTDVTDTAETIGCCDKCFAAQDINAPKLAASTGSTGVSLAIEGATGSQQSLAKKLEVVLSDLLNADMKAPSNRKQMKEKVMAALMAEMPEGKKRPQSEVEKFVQETIEMAFGKEEAQAAQAEQSF